MPVLTIMSCNSAGSLENKLKVRSLSSSKDNEQNALHSSSTGDAFVRRTTCGMILGESCPTVCCGRQ